jgi:magnesium-transporting ATPase (P-type)
MLWVNLMMDVLGAIALGTEPYTKGEIKCQRISRKDPLITQEVFRQIFVVAAYEIVVMMILMYFGNLMFFEESFNLVTTPLRDANGIPTNRMALNTMCFHTFFLMNWFNTLNCRVINNNETHPFNMKLINNPFLWLIMGAEMTLQHFALVFGEDGLGSAILGLTKMTPLMTGLAWMFGVLTLVVNIAAKQINAQKFAWYEKLDIEGTTNKPIWIDRVNQKSAEAMHKVNNQVIN